MTNDRTGLGTIGRLWVVATVAYGILRVVLAGAFLADYGLNVVVFAIIEIGSSLMLGISSARLTASMVAGRGGKRGWLLAVVVVSYFAPDTYVLVFAGRMPGEVLVPVLAIVCVGVITGIVRFRRFRSGVTSGS